MPGTYDHLPVTMTVEDIGHELQLGQRSVLRLIKSGEISALWLSSRCVRVTRESFISFLRGERPAKPEHPLLRGNPQEESLNAEFN